jgi:release factor glutamine methyltransferase
VTIGEGLRDAAVRLEPVGGTGRLDAVFLLAHAGGVSRQEMIAHRERELSAEVAERFAALVAERERGMPLAYVTGEAGFYGRMFGVDPRVLVPRPETELAVEWAVRHLRAIGRENGAAADVGTGSGAIAVTLACELPGLSVYASDVSQDALAVARHNAARNNVFQHVTFLHGDLAAPLLPYAPFDCVVANLPYVPSAECAPAPDPVSFEPLLARDGGAGDGLDFYRRLVADLPKLAAPRGIAVLEAGPANARALEALVRAALPHAGVETIPDYAGLDRLVVAVIPPEPHQRA